MFPCNSGLIRQLFMRYGYWECKQGAKKLILQVSWHISVWIRDHIIHISSKIQENVSYRQWCLSDTFIAASYVLGWTESANLTTNNICKQSCWYKSLSGIGCFSINVLQKWIRYTEFVTMFDKRLRFQSFWSHSLDGSFPRAIMEIKLFDLISPRGLREKAWIYLLGTFDFTYFFITLLTYLVFHL